MTIYLNFGAQRNDADVPNDDGSTELNQVEIGAIESGSRIVGKCVKKDEFNGTLVHLE